MWAFLAPLLEDVVVSVIDVYACVDVCYLLFHLQFLSDSPKTCLADEIYVPMCKKLLNDF